LYGLLEETFGSSVSTSTISSVMVSLVFCIRWWDQLGQPSTQDILSQQHGNVSRAGKSCPPFVLVFFPFPLHLQDPDLMILILPPRKRSTSYIKVSADTGSSPDGDSQLISLGESLITRCMSSARYQIPVNSCSPVVPCTVLVSRSADLASSYSKSASPAPASTRAHGQAEFHTAYLPSQEHTG
jgi:hypothetical protein